MGNELRLGDDGHPLEVFQVGSGDQLIQVLEAQLVLGQNNDVLGEAAGLAALRPQLQHLPVDLLQAVDAQFPFHFLKEGNQHIGHHGSIVRGPVVVEGGQIQMLRHNIQLILVQLRQQVLGQNQGVHIGGIEGKAHLPAPGPDEADVKFGVVGRQRAIPHKLQKTRQGLLQLGSVGQHGIRDARQAHDLRRQAAVGVDEGLKPLRHLAVAQHHGADLRDGLPLHLQSRGLDVEAHDLVGKILILRTMDGDAVVEVVDIISLHAVEDLDLSLGGVPCIREGLGYAVVGDGDGGMPPGDGLLDDGGRVRQGVHVGHLRMQVQLHPLLRGRVLAALMGNLHDVVGLELNVLAVTGQLRLPLHPQPHTGGDGALQGQRLLPLGIFAHGDGALIVRHVKAQHPHTGALGLPALGGKDLALHDGRTHFHVQLRHGDGLALDLLAQQHLGAAAFLLRLPVMNGEMQPVQAVLPGQQLLQRRLGRLRDALPGGHVQLQRPLLHVQRSAGDDGVVKQQSQFSRRHEVFKKIKKCDLFPHSALLLS